jgi:UDP-glucose 4-epimerase
VQLDVDLFTGRTGQFVFISSASAYQKPVGRLPIVESTPLRNPVWPYSQDKIACEELLVRAYARTASRPRSCGPRTRTTA